MRWLILFSFTIAQAQVTEIAKARTLRPGTIVTIAGKVTAGVEFGDLSFMQDGTGGIAVYNAVLVRDDSVVVVGKISRFNGLVEILADSVRKVGTPRKLAPLEIRAREAAEHEGELITIPNVLLRPPNHFFYPQRSGFLTKGADTLNYWIDGDTDIPGYSIPPTPVSITGIVGRFKDDIQIMPRSAGDITGIVEHKNDIDHANLSIMNWNLEFFGAPKYGPANDELQMANVAKLLNELKPDLIALQEVSNDNAFRELLKRTPGYEGRCSSRYSYSFDSSGDFPPQKLCFLYNTQVIHALREKVLFRKLYDDGYKPDMFSSGRLPYLLEADVLNNGLTERVHFINYHGKSGATADDLARRKFDAKLLKDTLDRSYDGKNVMILGDFNDDVDQSIAGGQPSPYAVLDNCVTKKLSDDGWHSTISYDDVIDHQFVSFPDALISVQIVNPFSIIPGYYQNTSDHLPVLSQFQWGVTTWIQEGITSMIYPNPAADVLNVLSDENFEYYIINTLGVIVQNGSATSRIMLDVPSGLYKLVIKKGPVPRTFTFIRSN